MPLARWIPSCATNKSKNQSTNDDTEHDANIHKRPDNPPTCETVKGGSMSEFGCFAAAVSDRRREVTRGALSTCHSERSRLPRRSFMRRLGGISDQQN